MRRDSGTCDIALKWVTCAIFFSEEEGKKIEQKIVWENNGWNVLNLLKINIQIQEAPLNSGGINRTYTHVLKSQLLK